MQEGLAGDVGPQHVGVAHLRDSDSKLAHASGAELGGTGLTDRVGTTVVRFPMEQEQLVANSLSASQVPTDRYP